MVPLTQQAKTADKKSLHAKHERKQYITLTFINKQRAPLGAVEHLSEVGRGVLELEDVLRTCFHHLGVGPEAELCHGLGEQPRNGSFTAARVASEEEVH